MTFFKVSVYFFYLTTVTCSASKSQPTDLIPSTSVTTITGNKLFEESSTEHAQRHASENKQTSEIKSPYNDPRAQVKVQLPSPKRKSMPIPFNILINNKLQTVPTKIPLVIKTATSIPAPAHYQRLKADPSKQNKVKPVEININLNKSKPKVKVFPNDRIQPNSILSLAHKSKKSRNEKQIPQKKLSSVNFYKDDINVEFLPPALKPVTRKIKKIEKNNPSKEFQQTVHNDLKQKSYEFETENDDNDLKQKSYYESETENDGNDEIRIKNGTHLLRITKLPPHEIREHESGHEHTITSHDYNIFNITPLPIALDGVIRTLNAKKDEVGQALLSKDGVGTFNFTEPTSCTIEPVVTQKPDSDESGVISITNHNYEEVEERFEVYPEGNFNEATTEWATSPWQDIAKNDQCLKYVGENNPVMYNKSNFYPRLDVPEATSLNKLEFPQTNSPPRETQVIQDIYFGQKPDFNIVDVHPGNHVGRIWRTWKDKEIKINKPNILLNKAIELGRCLDNLHETNFGEIKPQTLYAAPTLGLNGYYDSLNNQITYPYSYPGYRYML